MTAMMNVEDANAIRKATREHCNRFEAAQNSFIAYVQEQTGCNASDARKVYNLYSKERLLKIDTYMGTWHIKHGAFLDVDVLRRAINL